MAAALSITLGACSQEPDQLYSKDDSTAPMAITSPEQLFASAEHSLVNALVDSFDAPVCMDAQLRNFGRKTRPQGEYVVREFVASASCIYQLTARANALGFSEVAKNTFAGELDSRSEDRIRIEIASGENAGIIEWEIVEK